MSGFLTAVLVLLWIAACLGAIHSARYPHPRILRYNFDVAVRATVDIVLLTAIAFYLWVEVIR